jgi:hypothetical protein
MDQHRKRLQERPNKSRLRPNGGEGAQFLLSSEKQLLQSISARAPLPEVLNGICGALDCQIGNVVSLISLPGDDGIELATIAMNAAEYGLQIFCSGGIVAENGEWLGSLEMYCVGQRSPSTGEYQLIERATCLAAIAIKCCHTAPEKRSSRVRGQRHVRGYVAEWPGSMN